MDFQFFNGHPILYAYVDLFIQFSKKRNNRMYESSINEFADFVKEEEDNRIFLFANKHRKF